MEKRANHITDAEQAELALSAQQGDGRALERLITENMGFVINLAKKYQTEGLELDDLVSEGNIALMNAILKWNPEKNASLVGYAVYDIRKAMQRTVDRELMLVKIPEGEFVKMTSMDAPLHPGYSRSLAESMPQKGEKNTDDAADDLALKDGLRRGLEHLEGRDREVIAKFYGIDTPHMTMQEIGDALCLKRERVRQIRKTAERKLRKFLKEE